jgi:histone H3/H4
MTTLSFDTLKFARRLKEAGMDPRLAEEQAEALAEALEVNLQALATKADIKQLENDLRKDMQLMEQRLVIKLGSMLVVAVGVVAALVKLL